MWTRSTVPPNPRMSLCLQLLHIITGQSSNPHTHSGVSALISPLADEMFHWVQPHAAKHPFWNDRHVVAQNPGQGAQAPAVTWVSRISRYPEGNTMEGPYKATSGFWATRANSVLLAVFWTPVLPGSSCLLLYSVFTDSVLLTSVKTLPRDTESHLLDD